MADTAIPISQLVSGTNADVAGTAIVAANGHVITPTKRSGKVLIRLRNTFAGAKVFTVEAGDNPPASSAGQGDLTMSLADGSTTAVDGWLCLETARFLQSNGTIRITVAASTTGTITAFQLP
jgi:hypothetical protein